MPASDASQLALPAKSVHPVRKSYRDDPPCPASAPPPKSPLTLFRFLLPALRSHAPHTHPLPASAETSGPTSRSTSMAAFPAAHMPPAPYTPAPSLQGACA